MRGVQNPAKPCATSTLHALFDCNWWYNVLDTSNCSPDGAVQIEWLKIKAARGSETTPAVLQNGPSRRTSVLISSSQIIKNRSKTATVPVGCFFFSPFPKWIPQSAVSAQNQKGAVSVLVVYLCFSWRTSVLTGSFQISKNRSEIATMSIGYFFPLPFLNWIPQSAVSARSWRGALFPNDFP